MVSDNCRRPFLTGLLHAEQPTACSTAQQLMPELCLCIQRQRRASKGRAMPCHAPYAMACCQPGSTAVQEHALQRAPRAAAALQQAGRSNSRRAAPSQRPCPRASAALALGPGHGNARMLAQCRRTALSRAAALGRRTLHAPASALPAACSGNVFHLHLCAGIILITAQAGTRHEICMHKACQTVESAKTSAIPCSGKSCKSLQRPLKAPHAQPAPAACRSAAGRPARRPQSRGCLSPQRSPPA